MNRSEAVGRLVRDTFHRAVRETAIGVVLIGVFAYQAQSVPAGSPACYGAILIIASLGFVIGVLWSYVIGYRTLGAHPETDSGFWKEAFLTQAGLLRAVPLWYLTPVLTGVVVSVLPVGGGSYAAFLLVLLVCGAVFAGLTRLNRSAARSLEEQAELFT